MAIAGALIRQTCGIAVLVADGILVYRGIGLRCTVVGRGDAVTGLTTIIAVPVIHSAVRVFICRVKKIYLYIYIFWRRLFSVHQEDGKVTFDMLIKYFKKKAIIKVINPM